MSQENADVVRRMIDAFNRGDVDAVVAAFDEHCEVHEPPEMPDRPRSGFRGADGIRAWMTNLRDAGGVEFEPVTITSHGDAVLLELTSRGRGQVSGAPFQWTTFAAVHLHDAKIVSIRAFLGRHEAEEIVETRD